MQRAVFGPGFRNAGDLFHCAGKSTSKEQRLEDAADLAGCPPGIDPGAVAVTDNTCKVTRLGGW